MIFKSFQWQKHSDDLLECHNYFNNNRLFLSADMGSEINNILSNANLHLFILSLVLYRLKQDDMPAELIKSINDMITTKSDLGITKLSVKKPNLAMLMHQMVQQISQCKFTLENIYKSAAETPTKH